jgi:hypothetical protein
MATPGLKSGGPHTEHSLLSPALKTVSAAGGGSKKGHSYKPLPKEFRRDGFTYRQIAREGNGAIYEQRWTGSAEPSVCYEVTRIRRREAFEIGGRFVGPAEVYPASKLWGTDGFTLTDRDAAFAKLREIVASSNAFARLGQERKQSRLEKSPT